MQILYLINKVVSRVHLTGNQPCNLSNIVIISRSISTLPAMMNFGTGLFVESWHNNFMSSKRRRKLSHIEPGQHLGGRLLGNTGCCCHYLLDSGKKWQQHPVFPQNESSKKFQANKRFHVSSFGSCLSPDGWHAST